MTTFMGSPAPNIIEMITRLILTVIPVAGFALIGWGFKTDSAFEWYITTLTFWVVFSFQLKRVWPRVESLSKQEAWLYTRLGPARDQAAEVPIGRLLTRPQALQVMLAVVLAAGAATAEQPLAQWLQRSVPAPYNTSLALFLILGCMYFLEKLYRDSRGYEPSEWGTNTIAALLHLVGAKPRELSRYMGALVFAVTRASTGLIIRLLVNAVIPLMFLNVPATAGFALLFSALIMAGDFYFPAGRKAGTLLTPDQTPTRSAE